MFRSMVHVLFTTTATEHTEYHYSTSHVGDKMVMGMMG